MKTPSPIKTRKPTYLASTIAGLLAVFAALPVSAGTNYVIPGSPAPSAPQALISNDTLTISSGHTFTLNNGGDSTVKVNATSGTNYIWNSGTISHTGSAKKAIHDNANGNTLVIYNYAGAVISAVNDDAVNMDNPSAASSILQLYNYADIHATTSLESAVGGGFDATHGNGVNVGISTGCSVANDDSSSADGIIYGRQGIRGGDGSSAISITITNSNTYSGHDSVIRGVNGAGIGIDCDLTVGLAKAYADITNYGTIEGYKDFYSIGCTVGDGDGVDVDGFVTINNYGDIIGHGSFSPSQSEGISIGGGTITNYSTGLISGADNGILADDSNGGAAFSATTITNAGTIEGPSYAIRLRGNWNNAVTNTGTITGDVALEDGDDTVTNTGTITGNVDLGNGDNILTIGDGTSTTLVTGDISAGSGDDTVTIVGGDGTTAVSGNLEGGGGTDTLIFDQDTGETFTWGAYTISDFEVLVKKGEGVLDLTGAGTLPTGLTIDVEAGTLIISYSQLETLLNPGGMTPKGLLDISSTDYHSGSVSALAGTVIVQGGHAYMGNITGHLHDGYNSGYWNGPAGSILSYRAATNDVYGVTTLGSLDNYITGFNTFDGASVTTSDVVIKYTVYGDADLDGVVNGDTMDPDSDYNLFVYGFTNHPTPIWYYGDFDYDGLIDFNDFNLLVTGYDEQSDPR